MARLSREFYQGNTVELARRLVGLYLARRLEGGLLLGRITETEAYAGQGDKACHTYGGRRTARTEVMYGPGGFAYIYFTYGMHHCLNIVTEPAGTGSAVLIRGLAPILGEETIARLRFEKPYAALTASQRRNLLNGPGKICKGLFLTRAQNGLDLTGEELFVSDSLTDFGLPEETVSREIHAGTRIGIGYAEEAADFPWRFYTEEDTGGAAGEPRRR